MHMKILYSIHNDSEIELEINLNIQLFHVKIQ